MRAGVVAERRVRCARQELKLPDGIHRRADSSRVELGVVVVDTVEEELVHILARAVGAEGEVSPHRPGRALRSRVRAGRQQRELEKIPPVERQARNLPVVDDRAQLDRILLECIRRRDEDFLRHLADLEGHVEAEMLVHLQCCAVHKRLVPRQFDFHPVRARGKLRDAERASRPSAHGPSEARFFVHERQRCVSHCRPRWIGDGAANRAQMRLGRGRGGR